MPAEPLHCVLLICERVIRDAEDGVPSAIRIVDIFNVRDVPTTPPEERPVALQILFNARFPPDDTAEHHVEISLERPDGEIVVIGESEPSAIDTKYAETPKGLTLVGKFGVFPKAMGTHFIIIALDGKQVARAPFTLRLKDSREQNHPETVPTR